MSDPETSDWLNGAAAHGLALLLARRRFGAGVDMAGAHYPTPGEEQAAAQFMRDLLDNGWLDPLTAREERRHGYQKAINALLDRDRYLAWVGSDQAKVGRFVDYLESIAEEVLSHE